MQRTDILRLVGNTPLVEIRRLNPYPNVKIMAKVEFMNPGGSIKDRVAVAMIEAAEKSGELKPGKTIIEATSGNTGVGLAMVAAVKGYKMLLLMPDSASEERKRIMRGFGAEIRLTPGRMGTDGAIEEAYRLARTEPDKYVLMDQFNNPASIEAHYNGTGLEIWEQTDGQVTHAVVTLGTSGTAMGVAKRLHEHPGVRVVAVEPFAGHKIQGLKNMHESYPPGIYNKKALDQILHVEDEEAFSMCRKLACEEGLFVGMSSGAAMAGALQLAASLEAEGQPGYIVVIFPDSGERYLSTPLFAPKAQDGLRLMNLATGHKAVIDAAGSLNIYTIGPSLDEPDDPDAWRRLVLSDVLARHLSSRGAQVKVAVGLADLDDRTLSSARAAGLSRADYVAGVLERIKARAKALRLLPETVFEPASASVPQSLDICRKLLGKGQAYEKLRSVYFDVRRDKRYGSMHLMDMDKLSVGKTVDLDDYVKDNPLDFTLLKRASLQDLKLGDVIETEWGNVRPSWFVQIAVAGLAALGRVDVLVAGEDHQFPHLENLRVVWSAAGVEPKAWLADRKLAREEGVALDLDEIISRTGGQAGNAGGLRLWLLSAAYRKPLSASAQSLSMWARNWHKVQEAACGLRLAQGPADGRKGKDVPEDVAQAVFDLKAGLAGALEDDLSLHRYWPKLFTFVKLVNGWLSATGTSAGTMNGASATLCLQQLEAADAVLGILDLSQMPVACDCLPEAVRALVNEREAARKAKDFAASDTLRERLTSCGYRVEDTAQGPRVYSL
ncbi:MAG: cysteine synthase [Humidesulfovibrio sp.]|uniref:cysteine synthase n=1 Tax=Humidesulfovibrio sp. TaxID=2910988 RepID=UPI0027E65C3B|nr:cysteine synthase [Humidesulfovibrio sp.]MDQ7834645.1 cysteine synthase [Humidesulfovibrio sp.]